MDLHRDVGEIAELGEESLVVVGFLGGVRDDRDDRRQMLGPDSPEMQVGHLRITMRLERLADPLPSRVLHLRVEQNAARVGKQA